MEFTVPRNDLAVAVTHAVHGIPNNPVQPIRAGMNIFSYDGGLSFTGSDGDVTFTGVVSHPASGESITVPGKLLADVVRTLPDKDVHFETELLVATMTCGRVQFKFPVYKDDYPSLPAPAKTAGTVDSNIFAETVKKVSPASSKNASHPTLASMYLEPNGDTLWAVCTDKFRLAAVQAPWKPLEALEPVLVPPWAVERFTRGAEGTVSLGWDDRVVTMQADNLQVTSRVTGGEWPGNWREMLPDIPCTVNVDTEDLLGALKRAQLASEADSPVELLFTSGRLHIQAGYGNHSDDVLDAGYDGPEFRVLFGIGYLSDGLAGCGPVTTFGFTDPLKKVFVTSGSFSYTLLPRRRL